MIEVLRTNDPVRLSYAMALLRDAGCNPFVADQFMSSVEGGISAFQRRVLVPGEQGEVARAALRDLDANLDEGLLESVAESPAEDAATDT